jgi:very-short-patch-repair endonuclease
MKPIVTEMRHSPTAAENKLWQALRNGKLGGFKSAGSTPSTATSLTLPARPLPSS